MKKLFIILMTFIMILSNNIVFAKEKEHTRGFQSIDYKAPESSKKGYQKHDQMWVQSRNMI